MPDIHSISGLGDTGDQYPIAYKDVNRTVRGVVAATKLDENQHKKIREYFQEQEKASGSQPFTVNEWFAQIASHASRPDYDEQLRLLLNLIIAISYMRERGRIFNEPEDELSVNFIWSHIKAALEYSRVSFKVSRSSVGFVSILLCGLVEDGIIDELWRLHVWLPDGNRGNPDFCIHRHHTFGQSWILAGDGTDQRWKVDDEGTNGEETTHAKYRVEWNDGSRSSPGYMTHQASSTVINTYEYANARHLGRHNTLCRSMTYKISQDEWHSSEVADRQFLATLFVFDANRGANKDAPILGPKDGEKLETSKSPPPTTVGELVKLIEEARCVGKKIPE